MAIDVSLLGVFLLVLARTGAWVLAAPVFSTRGLSSIGRLALAIALSLFLAPLVQKGTTVPNDTIPFVLAAVGQVAVGLLLGWGTGLLLHAFEAAGATIDLSSGFSMAALLDPISGNNGAVFARFANLLFVTLFFATNAHDAVLAGFARSFDAVPANQFPGFAGDAASSVAHAVSGLLLAAIQIGAPVLGALFLTEVGLAIASRFAPQANVFMLGLPAKVIVTLLAMGTALVVLPNHLPGLIGSAMRTGSSLFK